MTGEPVAVQHALQEDSHDLTSECSFVRSANMETNLMTIRQPHYRPEEHARRGDEIYERSIRPQVEADNQGKIVAIDIDTGAFEIADDVLAASDRLLACYPNAQTWFVRIGHRAVHRFGPRTIPEMG